MTDYEKLKQIINEAKDLISRRVTCYTSSFQAWRSNAERFLIKKYGKNSHEHMSISKRDFSKPLSSPELMFGSPSKQELIKGCKEGLETSIAILESYLIEIKEETHDSTYDGIAQSRNYKRAFIVHGHDGELKHSVARILDRQGIEPIILSERNNQGRTIIEKFEKNSDNVCCAICLFTKDDFGRSKSAETDAPRARQNVVLETGYFWGKLGRRQTIILVEDGVELPSDLSGVVYTNTKDWQFALLSEMEEIGYEIDFRQMVKL